MQVTALLFDLDGTLVDTSEDIVSNLNRSLADEGLKPLPKEHIMSHVGYGAFFLVRNCLEEQLPTHQVSDSRVEKVLDRFREYYKVHIIDDAEVYPGLETLLERYPVPRAVVSNKPEHMVHNVLNALGLMDVFEFAWGKDSTDQPKPQPGVIFQALQKLGIEADRRVWFIGDSPVDIRAAKQAGVTAAAVSHGFSACADLEAMEPDFLVSGFPELLEVMPSPE